MRTTGKEGAYGAVEGFKEAAHDGGLSAAWGPAGADKVARRRGIVDGTGRRVGLEVPSA